MEALIERLSRLDSQAEGALRVVAFYDTLMRRRVDLPALARASAALAECVAGIRLHGTGRVIRTSPDGREIARPAESGSADGLGAAESSASSTASSTVPIVLDDEEIGTVWLERADEPSVLDEVVLDRLAIAVAGVVERYGPARTTMADPALVELVISADTDDAARARALRLLGFAVDLPVRVVAVRSALPLDRVGGLICPSRPVKAAPLGDVGVILATTVDAKRFPPDVRAGIGEADGGPDQAWRQARTALRFTTSRQPVLRHAELGALALLAQVPREAARANPDVAAIAGLAGTADASSAESPAEDAEDLRTLDAYCETGSLRRAAELLHLHHSSVARRLDQLGRCLGFDLTEPSGLARARIALTAWRLLADGEPVGEFGLAGQPGPPVGGDHGVVRGSQRGTLAR